MEMSDLKSLISEGEHQQQDFKQCIVDQKSIARTLCAFANTNGGRLLIGVNDKGKVKGIDPNEEYSMIEVAAGHYCKPPIFFRSSVLIDNHKQVLLIEVNESELKPHKAFDDDGELRSYLRIADRTVAANKIQEKVWVLQKKQIVHSGDFDSNEERMLQLIEINRSVTISKLYREMELPLKNVDRLLIGLICLGKVEAHYENGEVFYRLVEH